MSDNSNITDSTDTKTLVIDTDALANAYVQNLRKYKRRDVQMRVRWRKEWEGEQQTTIDTYDTSLYTKTHHREKPSAFVDLSGSNVPHESEILRQYAKENDINYSHIDEIREQADEEDLEAWIEGVWNVFEDQVRGSIIIDEEKLKRFCPLLDGIEEIRFE